MKTEQTIEQPTAPDGSLDDCFALMIRRAAELQDALCRHDEWRCLQFAMCISKCVIRLAKFMKRADPDAAIGFYYPSLRVFVPAFVGCVRVMAQDATATPTAAHNREDWDAAYALATEGQQIIAALCTLDQAQSWHRSTTCPLCAQPVPRLTKEKRERLPSAVATCCGETVSPAVSKNLSAAGNWWRVLKLATKIGVLGCKQRYLLIRNRQLARQLDVLLREQRSLRLQQVNHVLAESGCASEPNNLFRNER